MEDRPLEMCMDVPFDLKSTKLIIQPTRSNGEGLLQLTHQVDFMKDSKRSVEVAKGIDVHVKPKGAYMLTQKDMSLKELNLIKRKNELASVNGKLIVLISRLLVKWMKWI